MLTSKLPIVIGLAIGLVFLGGALALVDLPALIHLLARTELRFVLIALISVALYVWIKAIRWRLLLRPVVAVPVWPATKAVFAGNAVNFLVPHLGDLVRVWMIGLNSEAKGSPILATVAVERITDFVSLCLVAVAILLPSAGLSAELQTAMIALVVLTGVLAVGVVLFIFQTERFIAVVDWLLRVVPNRPRGFLLRQLRQGLPGLDSMRTPQVMLRAIAMSIVIWALIGTCTYASMLAVGVAGSITVTTAVILLNVVGLILPAAPGHFGTIQLAFVFGMQAFGFGPEEAFAASIVYNVAMILPVMLIGLPSLWRAGYHLRPILRSGSA